MSITSDILRGHTEAIILSHLLEQDSYGYQINKDIMKKIDNKYELKEATLYSAFRRLEQAGYIRTYWAMKQLVPADVTMPSPRRAERPIRATDGIGKRPK